MQHANLSFLQVVVAVQMFECNLFANTKAGFIATGSVIRKFFLTAHFQEFNVGGHLHVHVKWTVTALLDVASGSSITPCNKIKRGLQNDLVTLLNGVH